MKKGKEVVFDKAQPSLSLYNLALDYEQNPRKLEDAPQEFIDYFSLVGLAHSIKAVYPQLPYFNEEKVEETMDGRNFSSIDQLANFVKSNFHTDIERYRAIYTWVAHNILFDADALFANRNSYQDPEDIFKYKLTRSIHKLVLAIVSKSDISYSFTSLMCFGKGYAFHPNTPPLSPKEDDIPLLVEINGATFISDPAWGSGHIGEDRKFHQKYNPALFLKPYVQGLHRHFPVKVKLPIRIRYSKFLQINNFEGDPYDFYLESHPYQKYYCDSGYMKFYFSCKSDVKEIKAYLKYYDDRNNETDFDEDTSIKIISESPCKRFYVRAAFQKKGKYQLRVWLESEVLARYFINSTKAIEVVPFLKPKFGKNVVPLSPNVRTTKTNTNYAIIKFQAAKENAGIVIDVVKDSKKLPRNNSHSEFLVPGNDDLREIWACVPFPGPGFYTVHVYLYNGKNYSESLIYEYDVKFQEVIQDPNIYQFINEKKDFSPITDNKLNIQPDNSSIIMKPGSFTITALHPKNGEVLYNLNPVPSGNTIFSDSSTSSSYNSTLNKVTSSFTVKTPGLYKLLAFLGDDNVWIQYYYVTNKLPSDSGSSPSNFLSSIANEPVVLERPFVFPDDPNENQDDDGNDYTPQASSESGTKSRNLAPANSALLEEASAASLSFLQQAANTNSEFLKNASRANSEFLQNAQNNPSFLEEAMNMSASFMQQAGTLNALFYQQATSMIAEFLKVAESVSKGEKPPSLAKNPVFQNKEIFKQPKIDVSQKFKIKRPITTEKSVQCTLSDDEYEERLANYKQSSAQTNKVQRALPKDDKKEHDETPKKIVEVEKTETKPKEPIKPKDVPKPAEPPKPKDEPKPDEPPKRINELDTNDGVTPTILVELNRPRNDKLIKDFKILDKNAPSSKPHKPAVSLVPPADRLKPAPKVSDTAPPKPADSKIPPPKPVDVKPPETKSTPKPDDASTSAPKSNFKNLLSAFQGGEPVKPRSSTYAPPPKPAAQPKPTIPPPSDKTSSSTESSSTGNRSFKDLINRFNKK